MITIFLLIAVIPYPSSPSWESVDGGYTTGGFFVDVDKDSDIDLVVSNGNDMAQQTNRVYYNSGNMIETSASWQSNDMDYHGHCVCGDINNDGYPELAVSNYGSFAPNYDKLYMNNNGTYESNPSWTPSAADNSFGCAFGDVDNDGDLDLAFACGERYTSSRQRVKLYKNNNGTLEQTPSWQSDVQSYFYDVEWVDIDNDGDLDLGCAADGEANLIYENVGGSLGSSPYWQSSDNEGTIEIVFGDVDGDGDLDMAAANNAQISGSSRLVLYRNLGSTLETSPSWQSVQKQYYSCCAFGDVDMDGDLDLAGGGWWEALIIFENRNGNYNSTPDWSWITSNSQDLVCEEISFADIDNRLSPTVNAEMHPVSQTRRLVYLTNRHIRQINSISYSGGQVDPSDYCFSTVDGWVAFDSIFSGQDTVRVTYKYSRDIDVCVTNWRNSRGNFLFLNEGSDVEEERYISFNNLTIPAIVNGPLTIPRALNDYRIYDISGRVIVANIRGSIKLNPGVYFINGSNCRQKFIVIK